MASTPGSSLRAAWRDCIGSSAPAAPTPSWQRKSRRELMGPLLNVPFSHRDLSVSADVAQRYWQQGASSVRRFASLTEDRPSDVLQYVTASRKARGAGARATRATPDRLAPSAARNKSVVSAPCQW